MKEENSKFADIILKQAVKPLEYKIPKDLSCEIGHEVTVELGKRTTKGWVFNVKDQSSYKKSKQQLNFIQANSAIKPVLKSTAIFPEKQFELFKWMANYYGVDLNKVLDTALPKICLLYTSPSPRDQRGSRMPSSA